MAATTITSILPLALGAILRNFAKETVFNTIKEVIRKEVNTGAIPKQDENILIPVNSNYVDRYSLEAFNNEKPFSYIFKSLTEDLSLEIREIISESFKGGRRPSYNEFKARIDSLVDLKESRIENIIRTEHHRWFITGREIQYRELEDKYGRAFKYKWVIRRDSRTTDICKTIYARVPNEGLTLEELKGIVYEVQREAIQRNDLPTDWELSWTPHFQCRSRFVRVV